MPPPVPLSKRRPCCACGRTILLRFHRHTCVLTSLGARRYLCSSCYPFSARRFDFDPAA